MDYGMPTLIELDSLEETARLCQNLGLQFMELNMNLPSCQLEKLEETDLLSELKAKYDIYFTIHLDENLNVCDFNKLVAKAYTDTVFRTIQAARRLSVPILNLHMHPGVYFTLPDKKVYLFEKYSGSYRKAWQEFRDMCEDAIGGQNIRICIENTDGYREFEKNAIDMLLESPAFYLTWDIGHSHAANNIDEPFLIERKQKLTHFHIHDGLGKKNHLTLGSGDINLKQRLEIAETCNCRCVVETKTVEALKQSACWLTENGYLK
ncbi:MAG: sugar phosphate isomerase/epimerase [Muribaculaceae bacterium]|nr:sugar phosphate isomerase/epimerase [Roseburia sp.]MCM1429909.1 sugar phosphate isomerase/epimerase [Muribaculaceae bacterium]MCM1494017.1 sugar phosphate isomerase/epimerase [Muribaculaceae bacterium]